MTEETTPRPVRRATVRLAGATGTSARLAGTDDQGRFVFPDLPAGSYTLSATKPGYVTAFHGSTRPGRGPGVPVAVGDGQRVEATLRMLPGAVITGAITDARGAPVPSVPVTAVEVRPAGAVATPPARATTDDRGVYRIFGLAPGDYVVSAVPRLGGPGRGAITTDVVAVTDAEVRWARNLGTSPAPAGAPPPAGRAVTYAPVFYPGTANVAAATTITIAAGEERANVGFSLQIVPTARIAGTIVDQTGQPISPVSVFLYPRRTPQPSASDALIASGALTLPRAIMNGSEFSIPGVTPGDYTLVARTGSSGRGAAAAPAGPPTLWIRHRSDRRRRGSDGHGPAPSARRQRVGIDRVRANVRRSRSRRQSSRALDDRGESARRHHRRVARRRRCERNVSIHEPRTRRVRTEHDAAGRLGAGNVDGEVGDAERHVTSPTCCWTRSWARTSPAS